MTKGDGQGEAVLADPDQLARVQAELRSQKLDGWLLYDFKDRNPIARTLLGLEWTTRRAFAFIPADSATNIRPRSSRQAIIGWEISGGSAAGSIVNPSGTASDGIFITDVACSAAGTSLRLRKRTHVLDTAPFGPNDNS